MAKPNLAWIMLALFLASFLALGIKAQPYDSQLGFDPSNEDYELDYPESYQELIRPHIQKRGRLCVPRGRSCFPKANLCCNDMECRCNLFGSNCKCQKPGLFGLG